MLIAERLLTEQRATLATALYQAHTRRAALQRLMGLPIDELVVHAAARGQHHRSRVELAPATGGAGSEG